MTRMVAVTGATGFIGSHVVNRLSQEGWRVRVLTRRLPVHRNFSRTRIEAVIGTLDDADSLRELVRDAQAVVHVAGLVKARSRAEFFEANANGVARVAEAAARQPSPPRIVLLSSLAAREPTLSAYAASKRAGEQALTEVPGLHWTVFRPPAVYGPGDRETLTFFRCLARGFAPLPGPGSGRLSLIHVQDLAAAIAVTVASEPEDSGAVYELDDGHPGGYSWREMIDAAADHFGVRPRLVRVPRPLLHGAAVMNGLLCRLTGGVPMLSLGKVREICHPDWVCHDQTFRSRTAWRPGLPLKRGFAETIAWYRREGWL